MTMMPELCGLHRPSRMGAGRRLRLSAIFVNRESVPQSDCIRVGGPVHWVTRIFEPTDDSIWRQTALTGRRNCLS